VLANGNAAPSNPESIKNKVDIKQFAGTFDTQFKVSRFHNAQIQKYAQKGRIKGMA